MRSRKHNNRFFSLQTIQILCLVFLAATAWGQSQSRNPKKGPSFWVLERKDAKVYIFGYADARDRSWLTPTIEKAFQESADLWTESPPPPQPGINEVQKPDPSLEKRGYDSPRNLFEVLGPKLSARTLAVAARYGVPRSALEHLYPWRAYFVINSAYIAELSKRTLDPDAPVYSEFADEVLTNMALASHKPIKGEFNSRSEILGFFADMSAEAQSQRLEMLFDYYDDDEKGLFKKNRYDWITGKAPDNIILRMRAKQPALYRVEHVDRNVAWAARISQMLSDGGTHFVLLGKNHVLGPDSVLKKLLNRGLKPREVVNNRP